MTTYDCLEKQCEDFISRRQAAIDHGQNASHVEMKPLEAMKEIVTPSPVYLLSLSKDENFVAVAYDETVAVYLVGELVYLVRVFLLFLVLTAG